MTEKEQIRVLADKYADDNAKFYHNVCRDEFEAGAEAMAKIRDEREAKLEELFTRYASYMRTANYSQMADAMMKDYSEFKRSKGEI